MAKLKDIRGTAIQFLDADPVVYAGSWSSKAALNTARDNGASLGTTNAAMAVGGYGGPPGKIDNSETWNGTAWTEGNNLNTARSHMHGAGITTSAVVVGGEAPSLTNAVEKYNGTSWTSSTNYPTSKASQGGIGASNTAAVFFGGAPTVAETYEFDGTNWTETNDMNTGRNDLAAAGTQTAGIAIGGNIPPRTAIAETYNGSTWTEVGDMNTAKNGLGASTQGSTTSALAFGGSVPPGTAKTESWDGSSWTEVADLATARYDIGGSGTGNTSALAFFGGTPPVTTATEEFSFPSSPAVQEGDMWFNSSSSTLKAYGTGAGIPAGTWASSNTLNSPRGNAGSSGTQTAALFFGGDGPPGTLAITEQYNGSSWTEVGDLNVARSQQFFSNQGTQTAALSATGNPVDTSVESWNGSSWTETTENNTGRRNGASFGTQTAMLGTGGYIPPGYQTLAEQWDGSSWTEVANCPDPKFISRGGGGTTTAGIVAGNYPNGDVDGSQLWDGSSWTAGPNLNQGRSGIAFSATSQSSALAHGGGVGAPQAASTLCEFYNGTSWSELNDMAQGSQSGGGAGSSVSGIHMGGYGPGALTTTEEWTVDAAVSTVTTS